MKFFLLQDLVRAATLNGARLLHRGQAPPRGRGTRRAQPRHMHTPVMPLSDDEKRMIAMQYERLRTAIDEGLAEDDLAQRAIDFQRAYRGDARPLVDEFGAADDRRAWAEKLRHALAGEIAPEFWPARRRAVADDDAATREASPASPTSADDPVVTVDATCAHCATALTVRCAPLPGHALVTEHELTCPSCGRLTPLDLPGAVVDVVTGTR